MRSCHVTKRFRILATLKQGNKSMYSNTSGYVHMGKGKGKVLGRSPNSSVSVIPTCPKAQHATSYYTHQNSCNSGTVNSRET